MEDFDLKQFLVENKLTTNSKILSEIKVNEPGPSPYFYQDEQEGDWHFNEEEIIQDTYNVDIDEDDIKEMIHQLSPEEFLDNAKAYFDNENLEFSDIKLNKFVQVMKYMSNL